MWGIESNVYGQKGSGWDDLLGSHHPILSTWKGIDMVLEPPLILRTPGRVFGSSRDMPGAIVFSYREPGTGTRYKSPLESQAGNQTRVVSLRPPSPREWLRVTENDWEPT